MGSAVLPLTTFKGALGFRTLLVPKPPALNSAPVLGPASPSLALMLMKEMSHVEKPFWLVHVLT